MRCVRLCTVTVAQNGLKSLQMQRETPPKVAYGRPRGPRLLGGTQGRGVSPTRQVTVTGEDGAFRDIRTTRHRDPMALCHFVSFLFALCLFVDYFHFKELCQCKINLSQIS